MTYSRAGSGYVQVVTAESRASARGLVLHLSPSDNLAPQSMPDVVPFPEGLRTFMRTVLSHEVSPARLYLRRAGFDRITDSCGASRIHRVDLTSQGQITDPVMSHLQSCLEESLRVRGPASDHLMNHLIQALYCHLLQFYAGIDLPGPRGRGGLARWQLHLAVERIDLLLERGRIPLTDIAADCGLSVTHFTRAFTRSTGISPARWAQRRRVERAQELLRSSTQTLAQIAEECGFADRSCFNNVFRAVTQTTPARWRDDAHHRTR